MRQHLFQVGLRRVLLDHLADVGGASEGNLVNFHVFGDGGTSSGAVAAEDIDNTGGKACFLDEFGDVKGRQRSLLAGLEDRDASGGKAGAELPCEHEEGEVPGDDLAAHADGLVVGHGEEVAVDGHGLALDLVGPASVVAEAVDDEVEVSGRSVCFAVSGVRFAVVQRLELAKVRAVSFNEISKLVQQVAAAGCVHGPPGRAEGKGGAGSVDSEVDVSFIGLLHLADDLFGGRVDGGEGLAADRVDELAVDEQAGLEFGNVDVV